MKNYKNRKRVLSIVIALALVFSMSIVALADNIVSSIEPKVTLTAEGVFTFSDKNDLFASFKDMMPGDNLEQNIKVLSQRTGKVKIYLYARDCTLFNEIVETLPGETPAENIHLEEKDTNTTELLDYVKVKKGADILDLKAAGAGTAGVYLGTFTKDMEITLNVAVNLPIELGNEYQDAEAYVDWIFYAEEVVEGGNGGGDEGGETPTPPPTEPPIDIQPVDPPLTEIPDITEIENPPPPLAELPKTGDSTGLYLPATIMVVSGVLLAAVLIFAPRRKADAE